MLARLVSRSKIERLLDPASSAWNGVRSEKIGLIGTPVGLQPTAAIRAAWMNRKIGAVAEVRSAAIHDGRTLAVRLDWSDPTENSALADNTSFPDAAAILLPSAKGASVMTMGAPGAAVNAWYWRADVPEGGRQVVAEGLGTSRTVDLDQVRARGVWKEGQWHVVIARALRISGSEPVAQLEPGAVTGFAVAVWDGANGERAGIKAFSGDWRELRLEPTNGGRS